MLFRLFHALPRPSHAAETSLNWTLA